MQPEPVITLTTDFGLADPFVGVMKGVILSINPRVKIIDLTHGIEPYGIMEAALTVGMNYTYFPDGTVHVVVVDPGVGSARRPLLVAAGSHFFIGPDNGVFSLIFNREKESLHILHVTEESYFLKRNSSTFHGRDIFAPVAARLAGGEPLHHFGRVISDPTMIDLPMPSIEEKVLKGEIIHIDHFGNAISNISRTDIEALISQCPDVSVRLFLQQTEVPMKGCYADAGDEVLSAVINSSDLLEFFMHRGSAAEAFRISIGNRVQMKITP